MAFQISDDPCAGAPRHTSIRPKQTARQVTRLFMTLSFLGAALFIAAGARASVIHVAAGAVTGSASGCSLADAVNAANQSAAANTTVGACTPTGAPNGGGHGYSHGNVILLAAGSYIFTAPDNYWYGPNALPPIATDIVIVGAPDGSVIKRGTLGAPPFRLFYVGGGQSLTDYDAGNLPGCNPDPNAASCKLPGPGSLRLVNLTVRNGLARGGDSELGGGGMGAGGAIYNQSELKLYGVTLSGNEALGGSGASTATVGGAYGGGGIGGNASTDDDPQGHLSGGGFAASPWPDSSAAAGTFGNGGNNGSSGGVGGGGGSGGSGGFGGGGGNPGGGPNGGAGGFGGGGGGGASPGNMPYPGGIGGFGGGDGGDFYGGGGAGLGGAIFNEGGSVTMLNSTLADNAAAGGSGGATSAPGSGFGGALFNLNGTVVVEYATLADNTVSGATAKGGAVYNLYLANAGSPIASPAADAGTAARLTIISSILAGSTDGGGAAASDCENADGSLTSNHDVVQTPGSCTFAGSGDQTADPRLVPGPTINDGPTPTLALAPPSPAIQMGNTADAPVIDQRGYVRDAAPDAGAFEYGAAPPAINVRGLGSATIVEGEAIPAQGFELSDNVNSPLMLSFSSSNTALLPSSDIEANPECGSDASHYACTLSLTPASGATGSATVTVTATDAQGYFGQGTLVLTVIAPTPAAALSATMLDFGVQSVGGTGVSQSITLTNTGSADLTWTLGFSGAAAGDYSQRNGCPSPLAAGDHCAITITFKPTATGPRAAMLKITSSAASSPDTIQLTGQGAAVASSSGTVEPGSDNGNPSPGNRKPGPGNAAPDGGGGAFGWWSFLLLLGLASTRFGRKED